LVVEHCPQCGFDGAAWTDHDATTMIAQLPARFAASIDGIPDGELQRRPVTSMWSIAEYLDHVRETTFGMRFILATALDAPGTDLGEPPTSRFDPEPRVVDVRAALDGLREEAEQLHDQLRQLAESSWESTVAVGSEVVDVHWIARHAVHDATHHLSDIERLRQQI
jgi:DinB superfamily